MTPQEWWRLWPSGIAHSAQAYRPDLPPFLMEATCPCNEGQLGLEQGS